MTRALITGASRGIGAAIAIHLAKAGHDIILNYRSNDAAAKEVQGQIEALGQSAELSNRKKDCRYRFWTCRFGCLTTAQPGRTPGNRI